MDKQIGTVETYIDGLRQKKIDRKIDIDRQKDRYRQIERQIQIDRKIYQYV